MAPQTREMFLIFSERSVEGTASDTSSTYSLNDTRRNPSLDRTSCTPTNRLLGNKASFKRALSSRVRHDSGGLQKNSLIAEEIDVSKTSKPFWVKASRRLLLSFRRSNKNRKAENVDTSTNHSRRAPSKDSQPMLSRKHTSLMIPPQQLSHQLSSPASSEVTSRRHQTWYYSSNHVLVNRERSLRNIPSMQRNIFMDERAREMAESAARGKNLSLNRHDETGLVLEAGNILIGRSIREIHHQTMNLDFCLQERKNLLNPEFQEFGVGTYKDPSTGRLYLAQLFGSGLISV